MCSVRKVLLKIPVQEPLLIKFQAESNFIFSWNTYGADKTLLFCVFFGEVVILWVEKLKKFVSGKGLIPFNHLL